MTYETVMKRHLCLRCPLMKGQEAMTPSLPRSTASLVIQFGCVLINVFRSGVRDFYSRDKRVTTCSSRVTPMCFNVFMPSYICAVSLVFRKLHILDAILLSIDKKKEM